MVYKFTYIYHESQAFMQVNIPVPWIRNGISSYEYDPMTKQSKQTSIHPTGQGATNGSSLQPRHGVPGAVKLASTGIGDKDPVKSLLEQ